MSWKDNLQTASFRGVVFHVDSADLTGGRRSVVHEFPQRLEPYVEDLGLKPREISFEAFVIGDDYDTQRDRLLDALETAGSGLLVHPFHGSVRVASTGFRLREGKSTLGMAVFSLTFTRTNAPGSPSSEVDTVSLVGTAADEAQAAAASALDASLDFTGASFVFDSAHTVALGIASGVSAVRTAVGDAALFVQGCASILATSVTDFAASSVSGLLAPLWQDFGDAALGAAGAAARYAEMQSLLDIAQLPVAPAFATPSRLREQQNGTALALFAERMSVAELARSASLITPSSTAEAARLREQVTSSIDVVLDASTDDSVFAAFTSLRAKSVRDLAARARFAPSVVSVTPKPTASLLSLTHDSTGSLAGLDDIIARNRIRHPGFPGGDALEVRRAS